MPYVDNEGVRIRYEAEGEGPALVLQHGINANLETWHEIGYVDALKGVYRLIPVDARGHGCSAKPHDAEAYDRKLMALDVVAVLDELNVGKAHYLGYSMGGKLGFALAKYTPERFHSLIMGGTSPHKGNPEGAKRMAEALKERGMEAV